MNRTAYLTFILLLIFSQTVFSQSTILKGRITDSETHEPISFANIVLKKGYTQVSGTATDLDGNYQISPVDPGVYRLVAVNIGYMQSIIDSVVIKDGIVNTIDIKLERGSVILDEVVISGYRVPLIQKDKTTSGATVTSGQIVKMSGYISKSIIIDADDDIDYQVKSGTLTATEINDFSKWELWKDISKNELAKFQNLWNMSPEFRYSIQVLTKENRPVIDAVAYLESSKGDVLWSAKTDNTGKAELWAGFFENEPLRKNKIIVEYDEQSYTYPRAKLIQKGMNILKIPVECTVPDNIDIAFVVDATGSMDDEIDFLKTDLIDIIHHTKEIFPEANVNLASVFYRCYGNEFVTRKIDLSPNIQETIRFIRQHNAREGGGEVVEEAFQIAVDSLTWSESARAKIIFFVLDEQPLSDSKVIAKMHYYTKKAAEKGIRLVPIIASAESMNHAQSMEYLLRSMALATNGTTLSLTDHSGVGNEHATPTTDEYDVEYLNSLIKRIIYQFSYVPNCDEAIHEDGIQDTTYVSNITIIAHEVVDSTKNIEVQEPEIYVIDYSEEELVEDISTNLDTVQMEKVKLASILFYPNPTKGPITVEIEGEISELYLFDISGKLISKYNSAKESVMQLNLSDYGNGIYFIKFRDKNRWFSGKLILSQ